ncbi:hypothetical protein BVRB_1g009060 [Beta vulgaris subsp. vulgaris]|nr:hypothetical protein BVRB_1g009060 [Beta vulgaris subsp. vulgaris]
MLILLEGCTTKVVYFLEPVRSRQTYFIQLVLTSLLHAACTLNSNDSGESGISMIEACLSLQVKGSGCVL